MDKPWKDGPKKDGPRKDWKPKGDASPKKDWSSKANSAPTGNKFDAQPARDVKRLDDEVWGAQPTGAGKPKKPGFKAGAPAGGFGGNKTAEGRDAKPFKKNAKPFQKGKSGGGFDRQK